MNDCHIVICYTINAPHTHTHTLRERQKKTILIFDDFAIFKFELNYRESRIKAKAIVERKVKRNAATVAKMELLIIIWPERAPAIVLDSIALSVILLVSIDLSVIEFVCMMLSAISL